MKRLLISLLMLIGCTHHTVFRNGNSTGASIRCINNLGNCYFDAQELCPNGYDIVSQNSFDVDPSHTNNFTKSWTGYNLVVQCKSEEVAPRTITAPLHKSRPVVSQSEIDSPNIGATLLDSENICGRIGGILKFEYSAPNEYGDVYKCWRDGLFIFAETIKGGFVRQVQTFYPNANVNDFLSMAMSKIGRYDDEMKSSGNCLVYDWRANENRAFSMAIFSCPGFVSVSFDR